MPYSTIINIGIGFNTDLNISLETHFFLTNIFVFAQFSWITIQGSFLKNFFYGSMDVSPSMPVVELSEDLFQEGQLH